MRVLHTADWHLGRTLEGRSRHEEHVRFVDELCDIVTREAIDMVVIAGDIFDTINPPSAAEELYCDALARLGEGGRRAVVVIAGNHDSPDRLCAVAPLAQRHGVTLFGYPWDDPGVYAPAGNRVRRVASGPGWAEIAVPGVDHSAVVLALPYPSEARLGKVLADTVEEEELQPVYSAQVAQLFGALAGNYRADTVRLAASHLFVAGGKESADSERPIQVGGAYTVEPGAFPAAAQYVALGHLHRPQQMHGAHTLTRYAGSPLAFSFSEAGYAKSVTVVDVLPNGAAAVQEIPIAAGKPLVRWKADGGPEQVAAWVAEGRDPDAWIDLELHLTRSLEPLEIQALRRMHPGFIHIRPIISSGEAAAARADRVSETLEQRFIRFYQRQKNTDAPPPPELVRLFLSLTNQSADAEVEA